ncbi:hypothetical protein C8A01DRAFT_13884 [Parachaetomium inaequale]|uniref:F-box domain-containing protein n=1 Tax=Parachaetomium inaequale TaxID=2588326 RepID=A0AAN6PK55_9PEZI|nr:hypothetical protein C8A01DRAFT_13884 [Parachaetomium inaequale]
MEACDIPAVTAAAAADSIEPKTPGLLRLPPHVRSHIYRYLQPLVRWDGHPFTFDLHGRKAQDRPPEPPSDFRGLLLCCRTIYAEAVALLYSANRFVIYYTSPGSLEPLHALTPRSLASLAHLKVVLNQSSCHAPSKFDGFRYCCSVDSVDIDEYDHSSTTCCKNTYHAGTHRRPLTSCISDDDGDGGPTAQVVLSEWHAAATYLASHISTGQLELSLVCDINHQQNDSLDVGKRVVAPLQLLPRLKNCLVRLCATPDPQLRQLAQDTVLQARRTATPKSKPPLARTTFVTLPRELRLRILEHTDLITPRKEVTWSRTLPVYSVQEPPCREADFGHCLFPDHHGCQFFRCSERMYPSDGCFCRRLHAAFSSTCRCWAPPGHVLFSICRTLCRDAQLVFFSGNRFIVHDCNPGFSSLAPRCQPGQLDYCDIPTGNYPYHRFAVSRFLREVVPTHCLTYLRFLEIVFPPYPHHFWPRPGDPASQHWCATVDWLRDKINGPGLTVWLITEDEEGIFPTDRKTMTETQGQAIVRAYINIMGPLKQLAAGDGGLARFYVQLAYPWTWTQANEVRVREDGGREWYDSKKEELKDFGESYVMGARYTSLYADDKRTPEKSIWQHMYTSYN